MVSRHDGEHLVSAVLRVAGERLVLAGQSR